MGLHPVRGPDDVLGQSWLGRGNDPALDGIPIKLGPVGGRIVADVFAALLRGDPTSYLKQGAPFKPIPWLTPDGTTFGLAELINFALKPTPWLH